MLDVSNALLTPGTSFPFTAKASLPPQDVMGETVTIDEIALEGVYTALQDAVHLRGMLCAMVRGLCARCLKPAELSLEIPFAEAFRKDADEWQGEDFRYEGHTVSLDQLVLTLVTLNLPMRFLCKADCDGRKELQAGQVVVSKGSCEDGTPVQRPFEALQRLLKKEEAFPGRSRGEADKEEV
ncbi:MAG: DUF177 domain-containing protein [Clostridia bacterium]|nr:DUF177 domain-containing protein [Clostridia bacterium]